jgi:hypothetical protein
MSYFHDAAADNMTLAEPPAGEAAPGEPLPAQARNGVPYSLAKLAQGVRDVYPNEPPQSQALLTALLAVEGGGYIQNDNPGNLSAAAIVGGVEKWRTPPSGANGYWRPPWYPDDGTPAATHQAMLAGKAPSAFWAFSTVGAGLKAWKKAVSSKLLEAARTGDAAQFVAALHDDYSPDYGDDHVGTFERLQLQIANDGLIDGATAPSSSSGPSTGTKVVAGLIVASALGILVGTLSKRRRR